MMWALVAHSCHLKLCERLSSGESQCQTNPKKIVFETPSQWEKNKKRKLGVVARAYYPSNRRIMFQAHLGKKTLSPT
jgi:hypothetical protein